MTRIKSIGVAFLVSDLSCGGAEKHTIHLFNSLDRSRFRVALVYLKRNEQLLPQVTPDHASEMWCADFGHGLDFYGLYRLSKWLRSFDPEVLLPYTLFYGHLARILAGVRARIIAIFHSTDLPADEDRKMRLIYRHFFNLSDRVIYVSQAQQTIWESRGIRPNRGVCIHNGIDVDYFADRYSAKEKAEHRAR